MTRFFIVTRRPMVLLHMCDVLRPKLEMLNLSENRMGAVTGLGSLSSLIVLNLGKPLNFAFCVRLQVRSYRRRVFSCVCREPATFITDCVNT